MPWRLQQVAAAVTDRDHSLMVGVQAPETPTVPTRVDIPLRYRSPEFTRSQCDARTPVPQMDIRWAPTKELTNADVLTGTPQHVLETMRQLTG